MPFLHHFPEFSPETRFSAAARSIISIWATTVALYAAKRSVQLVACVYLWAWQRKIHWKNYIKLALRCLAIACSDLRPLHCLPSNFLFWTPRGASAEICTRALFRKAQCKMKCEKRASCLEKKPPSIKMPLSTNRVAYRNNLKRPQMSPVYSRLAQRRAVFGCCASGEPNRRCATQYFPHRPSFAI